MKKSFKGTVLVVLAAIAWGISGVSGQFLMKQGISVYLLTSLRLLISGLLLIGVVIWQQPQQIKAILEDKKVLVGIFGFSICGLLLNQFSYLQAIHYTNAGTATVLQYMAPVLVLTIICFKNRSCCHSFSYFGDICHSNAWTVGQSRSVSSWSFLGSLFCCDLYSLYAFAH